MSDKKLTTKQKLFVEAYLINPNATEAARKAGYKGNDNTLKQVASENLAKPYLADLLGKRVEEAVMSANEVLEELANIAKADWQEFLSITRDRQGDVIDATLKLSDKIKALELVGRYHKLFTDKIEHGGEVGLRLVDESE
jgi:phage terminase small subunit